MVILGNDHSPNGGLVYPFAALSVQFHPEFGPAYVAGLLDRMELGDLSDAQLEDSRGGLYQPIDTTAVARAFAGFYRVSCAADAQAG
jgi:hypothetical protein